MRTILVGIIILIFISVQLMRGGAARYTIEGDGSGYYAYLTTVFVYKTTDFKDVYSFEKSWRGLDYMAHYFHTYGDKLINKYFFGHFPAHTSLFFNGNAFLSYFGNST